jgi:hypothetical protein
VEPPTGVGAVLGRAGGHSVVADLPGLCDPALGHAALTELPGDQALPEGVGADVRALIGYRSIVPFRLARYNWP